MSLTVQNVYDHIQPYLLRKLTKEQLEWVFNTEMIRLINDVTEDIAKITECNREWFHQKVSGQQFILAGEPTDFIQFKFYNELFSNIKWCSRS